MIKEITVELNGVANLNIYEDTEVAQLLQDYSDNDEFTLSQINIVTDDGTLEVKAYDKWFDYDDLEELLTKLYELYEKDVSELYYELPDGDVRTSACLNGNLMMRIFTTSILRAIQSEPFVQYCLETCAGMMIMFDLTDTEI